MQALRAAIGFKVVSLGLTGGGLLRIVLKILLLGVLNAFILFSIFAFIGNGHYVLGGLVFLLLLGINIVVVVNKYYPFKWFALGLSLITIMLVYPTLQTLYSAFTNYGEGHLLTKVQVLDQLQGISYRPEGGGQFTWTAFRSETGNYLLRLESADGAWLAVPGEELLPFESAGAESAASDSAGSESTGGARFVFENVDADGIPNAIRNAASREEVYVRINRIESLRYINELSQIQFGQLSAETLRAVGGVLDSEEGLDSEASEFEASIQGIYVISLDTAEERINRYVYDSQNDTLRDRQDGRVYSPLRGSYTAENGDVITPGYPVPIGFENFTRLFTSPALRGPFTQVFVWTFVYAGGTVVLSFIFGLLFAIVFDHSRMRAKKLLRSLLLIPYAIPAFISVNVWRGMFQPHFGVISLFLEGTFGSSPLWFADPFWAKFGILIIQTWLGYPYMMLICTGALQSIPRDIYEAARIDGANPFQQFWNLTLPLLLVSVGPLLIASFAFHFNNFAVIDIYSEGGPPIANTLTPAGHTDILITYIFRLAFSGGRGADLGYASAITLVIFAILAIITALQFRFTRVWEEISENV